MADYDVGVVALTTPAPSAPLAQTRPVVSVRNNGLHDAVASGYIRIYSAGLLVYESEAYSDTIGPGETRPCSAIDYWTPEAEGPYMVQGYFSTPLDQVEPNNNLLPTLIVISGAEPPPPTPVPLHASQHESGGADEMSIEDLPGRAGDAQMPINHASFHENAGIDRIDVTDLPGLLGTAQTPKAHATSHKVGGSDVLDVLTLPNVTALELVARKGANNGYCPLDSAAVVPQVNIMRGTEAPPDDRQALLKTQIWGYPIPHPHAASHGLGGSDPLLTALNATGATVTVNSGTGETTIATITIPAGWMNSSLGLVLNAAGRLTSIASPGEVLRLKVKQDAAALVTLDINVSMIYSGAISLRALVAAIDYQAVKTYLEFLPNEDAAKAIGPHVITTAAATNISAAETIYTLTAEFPGGGISHQLLIDMSHSFNTGQPS